MTCGEIVVCSGLAVAGWCFLLAGSGDGEPEGEMRESRDKVEQ